MLEVSFLNSCFQADFLQFFGLIPRFYLKTRFSALKIESSHFKSDFHQLPHNCRYAQMTSPSPMKPQFPGSQTLKTTAHGEVNCAVLHFHRSLAKAISTINLTLMLLATLSKPDKAQNLGPRTINLTYVSSKTQCRNRRSATIQLEAKHLNTINLTIAQPNSVRTINLTLLIQYQTSLLDRWFVCFF